MKKTINYKLSYIKDFILEEPEESDMEVLRTVVKELDNEPEYILEKLSFSELLDLYIKKFDKYGEYK